MTKYYCDKCKKELEDEDGSYFFVNFTENRKEIVSFLSVKNKQTFIQICKSCMVKTGLLNIPK